MRKIILPIIFVSLAYGFYKSSDFKEICAGVAIFLLGMLFLEMGFKAFSGGVLERILKASTSNLAKSISFGFISTALMQSSSLVSVLAISFLGAGLIELVQGIGIIYGANIGTTTGAWLMAGFGLKIDLASYAMPMIIFGVILNFQSSKSLKGLGYILTGMGFLFLGIAYMKDGFEAIKEGINLSSFAVPGFKGLLLFIGVGIVATVVMQSSHATIILVITALATDQINYENAIAITIGANIGTTITAVIGSLSSNVEGKRLAGAHFIFNVTTAFIAVILINPIMNIVNQISDFLGIELSNHALRLAVFDSFFKVMGVVIMVGFTGKLVSFLQHFIKAKQIKIDKQGVEMDEVRYINSASTEFPSTAFTSIVKESKHLYENTFEIITHGLNIHRANLTSSMDMDEVLNLPYNSQMVDIDTLYKVKIKNIYSQNIAFITKAQYEMPKEYFSLLYKLKLANRDLVEAIKDMKHLQKNLHHFANSSNEAIKQEYNRLRRHLAQLLRDVNALSNTDEEELIVLMLSHLKNYRKERDIIADSRFDTLIKDKLITNEMATSLINDNVYVSDISKNLITMAEILFVLSNQKIVSLGDEYMDEESEEIGKETPNKEEDK